MTFDVIIATRNRHERLQRLLHQIVRCTRAPQKIIVVDSSDSPADYTVPGREIVYTHTVHRNQPYQRYLGSQHADADIVIFLDDDVEIVDVNCFQKFLLPYTDRGVVGVTVGIDYKNIVSVSLKQRKFSGASVLKGLSTALDTFTGVPPLRTGEIFLAGLAGGIPVGYDGQVTYFQGANMSFRRSVLTNLFDDTVFDLYQAGVGKGEDKMLSMRANRFGRLYSVGDLCLKHPPIDSHYLLNNLQFHRRASFSRLYLSRVYCDVFDFSWVIGILHYYWFSMWRILFSLIKVVTGRSRDISTLRGQWSGLVRATIFLIDRDRIKSPISWFKDPS